MSKLKCHVLFSILTFLKVLVLTIGFEVGYQQQQKNQTRIHFQTSWLDL